MQKALLAAIFIISLLLRVYGIDWGAPWFFHPDERNIASSVSQLHFPEQLNPQFFAYGSFPIYITFVTGMLINFFSGLPITNVSFEQAIIISRFYSAIFSFLTVVLTLKLSKKLLGEKSTFFVGILCATSVGLVQFAHFGTFEMWLTFLTLLLFYVCLNIVERAKMRDILLANFILGFLVAIKISSLILIPLPFVAFLFHFLSKKQLVTPDVKRVALLFISILLVPIIFLTTSPFALIDSHAFINSLRYESSVALGLLPVFYTGQFLDTTPIFFQFVHIYPFILNPVLTILFLPAFLFVVYISLKHKQFPILLLITFYMLLFFSQALVYAKWTRYILPTIPFMYILIGKAFSDLRVKSTSRKLVQTFVVGSSLVFAISYLSTAFVYQDTRVLASQFAKDTIPKEAKILSEVFDLGITPFNPFFSNIILFNFYDLDQGSGKDSLNALLPNQDYIVLPSQRIIKGRLLNASAFPNGHRFYTLLQNGGLDFEKIYETPCDIFCKIIYLGDPVFRLEETTNVFDRPTVFIFKKTQQHSQDWYAKLLESR